MNVRNEGQPSYWQVRRKLLGLVPTVTAALACGKLAQIGELEQEEKEGWWGWDVENKTGYGIEIRPEAIKEVWHRFVPDMPKPIYSPGTFQFVIDGRPTRSKVEIADNQFNYDLKPDLNYVNELLPIDTNSDGVSRDMLMSMLMSASVLRVIMLMQPGMTPQKARTVASNYFNSYLEIFRSEEAPNGDVVEMGSRTEHLLSAPFVVRFNEGLNRGSA